MMTEFRKKVLKVNGPRKHKVTNSFGVYDAYKYIRKNKWMDIPRPITEHEFYSIVRKVNLYLADNLVLGKDIYLPCRMGRLELRKYNTKIKIKDNKVITNLPVDWDRTLKLWAEDEESYKNRTLVKMEEKEIFKVHFNRWKADFSNKSFYEFIINRNLKLRLKNKIKEGQLDAFKLYE